MVFIYTVSIILAFLLGRFLPKRKIKVLRKKEEPIDLKEIRNFLNYDGDLQE